MLFIYIYIIFSEKTVIKGRVCFTFSDHLVFIPFRGDKAGAATQSN